MHRVPQVQARTQLQIARVKSAFEQQDRTTPAEGPHPLGLTQVQESKTVSAAQAFKHPLDAVAIRIGFDYGPGLGVGCGLPGSAQVVAQRGGVDGGLNRTGHGVAWRGVA